MHFLIYIPILSYSRLIKLLIQHIHTFSSYTSEYLTTSYSQSLSVLQIFFKRPRTSNSFSSCKTEKLTTSYSQNLSVLQIFFKRPPTSNSLEDNFFAIQEDFRQKLGTYYLSKKTNPNSKKTITAARCSKAQAMSSNKDDTSCIIPLIASSTSATSDLKTALNIQIDESEPQLGNGDWRCEWTPQSHREV